MIEVGLPAAAGGSLLVRSFAACLASATETPLPPTPLGPGPADLAEAVRTWRGALAAVGLGLVEVAAPAGFTMPGFWIAVTADGGDEPAAVLCFGTPPGVVLSPARPALLGRAAADLRVERGFVLAALDPAAAATPGSGRTGLRGRVEVIAVAGEATAPMRRLTSARALAGHGLDGDRYARHAGTFTPARRTTRGHDLTLIEAEALDALAGEGVDVAYADARRNVVTRGIDLNALVGRRFRIGDVELLGQRLCEPCVHLERLTGRGVLRGLIHRGGLRADVLTDGVLTTGATVETVEP